LTARILNSSSYTDTELEIIKEKIFYEYNYFNYNKLKLEIDKLNTELREKINAENEKVIKNTYKFKYYWLKLKLYFKEIIQKSKLNFVLRKMREKINKRREEIRKKNKHV